MPNRLIHETSPYLLQHAHNPVDWHPWGEEALRRAREEDKPIFLSIGYSACHWCHVMERESFENEEIARLMNESLISIKVDREERPDLDSLYMDAVQAMTGHGGWPMSVFLTPDGAPFFGGTYFPPEDRPGMAGFPRVMEAVLEAYRTRRADVANTGSEMVSHLRRIAQARGSATPLTADLLQQAYDRLALNFDGRNGGFGTAPKFPQPMLLEFLLRYYLSTGTERAREMAELALERMARGGIYDHLGGGFHRYSTDARWLVPHFEKMLYDNALLSRAYLHAYQITGRADFRRVTEETLDYLLRDMRDPKGGFYATQDADSEGEEGRYYVWTPHEVMERLGPEEGERFCRAYDVTIQGNFEGRTVLNRLADETAADGASLTSARAALLEARSRRVPPARDEKVLTAWNGLALRSLAEAASVLDRDDYRRAAAQNAAFLLETLRDGRGRLLRSYKDGEARLRGYLEDYAFLADGLLALYEATFDRRWLDEAVSLAGAILELFWDEEMGLFYDTSADADALVVRPRTILDNAIPSGGAFATELLLRLSAFTGEPRYTRAATAALGAIRDFLARHPAGMGHWLCALDLHLSTPKEIALVGPLADAGMRELLAVVYRRYMPNKVLIAAAPEDLIDMEDLPLMDGRDMIGGMPTAYVCENYVCKLPVTDPEALAQQLAG